MQPRLHWDIFCQVVDYYGDIGVCWRLARQLVHEQQCQVRLWVDDLNSFAKLAPTLDPSRQQQMLGEISVQHWIAPFPDTPPAQVVIEAFACHLPQRYIAAMAAQAEPPLWLNLEYLSAEPWVAEHHGLPSPHPRLPLTKYFFFPGFSPLSGGLIRESALIATREAFQQDAQAQSAWWQSLGVSLPPGALTLSLFAYPSAPIAPLLQAWAASATPVICLVPNSELSQRICASLGCPALLPGTHVSRGNLTVIGLPFLSQLEYDRLLWACDLNFVRGEDSFVRAQWAGKPLIWNIYPQQDSAHQGKLEAFLALYCQGLDTPALAALWRAWNGWGIDPAEAWPAFAAALPDLKPHAQRWSAALAQQTDLATQLVKFGQ